MANLYSNANQADDRPTELFEIPVADITVYTRVINGIRRYAISQVVSSGGSDVVAVSYEEVQELVSGLQEVLVRYAPEIPGQLRLFDPDNPPLENTNVNGVDPA